MTLSIFNVWRVNSSPDSFLIQRISGVGVPDNIVHSISAEEPSVTMMLLSGFVVISGLTEI